ncbi:MULTISPECIES: ABC-type transport auxiliary lipoprotein family protein [Marinobacter]|uniref:ABC-type transport auxiliary lipoprotein family protein n=1 Tax=Marinobacter xiaoshiensis TaxID=3073652 RepID=A0ABU2HFZ0_9GAMM|nr:MULTISPECIES: ABC-type transport auxiliary lipoprotein family protein [unclassified Marinobacter]MBK1874636.1 membrane integrity-associated transporter subunit PqiC [Marinobacter sp. 1-3A]MDS1309972.1 ABC-type transport auxiliary lipoprotein family protein [Marinobacter sp. F60267]
MSRLAIKGLKAAGVAFVISGSMAACTVFPVPEAPRVMDFPTPLKPDSNAISRSKSLRIDMPVASDPYNSSRILAKPQPWEFRVYGGVRWRDTVPVLVRDMLAGAFRASASFQHVVMDPAPGSADLSLSTEINAFHAINQGDSTRVTVSVYGQLVNNRSQGILCSRSFTVSTPAEDTSIDAVVLAFGNAGEQLADELIAWATSCEATPS